MSLSLKRAEAWLRLFAERNSGDAVILLAELERLRAEVRTLRNYTATQPTRKQALAAIDLGRMSWEASSEDCLDAALRADP